jgi:hypothetical protein
MSIFIKYTLINIDLIISSFTNDNSLLNALAMYNVLNTTDITTDTYDNVVLSNSEKTLNLQAKILA